jgi:hypothetical protein
MNDRIAAGVLFWAIAAIAVMLQVGEGVQVNGEFVGGTGSLKGLTGSFTFTWTSTFTDKDQGIFTGHTQDLSGSYRIP